MTIFSKMYNILISERSTWWKFEYKLLFFFFNFLLLFWLYKEMLVQLSYK